MMLIFKGERDTTNPSNYKPLSLIGSIGNILERHLEENDLLNVKQFEEATRKA